MAAVGRIQSLWRYPVKSMKGQELSEVFVGSGGVRGDRLYAVHNARGRADFPYFTAREQGKMLQCRPTHRAGADTDLEIDTPDGEKYAISDEQLLEALRNGLPDRFELTMIRSERAQTDCSPVSLLSIQTVQQLTEELGRPVDPRRFRANLYVDLFTGTGFTEDQFVGRKLKIGTEVVLTAVERDVRCKMITLHPDTAEPAPELMKLVAGKHEGCVGIYANVIAEGTIRTGDVLELLD